MNIKEFIRAVLFLTCLVIAMGAMETAMAGQYHSQPGDRATLPDVIQVSG